MSDIKQALDTLGKTILMVPYAKGDPERVRRMVEIARDHGGSETVIEKITRRVEEWEELPGLPVFRSLVDATKAEVESAKPRRDCPRCHGSVWLLVDALLTFDKHGRGTTSFLTEEAHQRLKNAVLPPSQQLITASYPCWECEAGAAIIASDEKAAKAADMVRVYESRRDRPAGGEWAA